MEVSSERESNALSMAPILGAMGMDYKGVHFEAQLKEKRANALYRLIETLDETEKERVEFQMKQQKKEKGRAEMMRMLGI